MSVWKYMCKKTTNKGYFIFQHQECLSWLILLYGLCGLWINLPCIAMVMAYGAVTTDDKAGIREKLTKSVENIQRKLGENMPLLKMSN